MDLVCWSAAACDNINNQCVIGSSCAVNDGVDPCNVIAGGAYCGGGTCVASAAQVVHLLEVELVAEQLVAVLATM